MGIFNSIVATIRFEISRVMTVQRMIVALVMVLFPPAMIMILMSTGTFPFPEAFITVLCGMVCLLSLLLWSTGNVYTELEGRSWAFVTTRPFGRWSILFGKYAIGFLLSFFISWISLSICMLVAADADLWTEAIDGQSILGRMLQDELSFRQEPAFTGQPDADGNLVSVGELMANATAQSNEPGKPEGLTRFRIWMYLSILLFLASMVYSSIFSLLGVIIQRRAMVFAVGYIMIVEGFLAFIPALIGKVAMSYHLICLMGQWAGFLGSESILPEQFQGSYDPSEPWVHLLVIISMTLSMLGLSSYIIRVREYITLDDAQI